MEREAAYKLLMEKHISASKGERRSRLMRGLGRLEEEFLRHVWYPAVGHFDDVYPEWEIRDYNGKARYVGIAYMPAGMKGAIEIQGGRPHARDADRWRWKDESLRHCYLVLDGWTVLPITYDMARDNRRLCQQLVLAFVGRFIADPRALPQGLDWLESEVLRFARRSLRPFTPDEVRGHLRTGSHTARKLLHSLVDKGLLKVSSGKVRARRFALREGFPRK